MSRFFQITTAASALLALTFGTLFLLEASNRKDAERQRDYYKTLASSRTTMVPWVSPYMRDTLCCESALYLSDGKVCASATLFPAFGLVIDGVAHDRISLPDTVRTSYPEPK